MEDLSEKPDVSRFSPGEPFYKGPTDLSWGQKAWAHPIDTIAPTVESVGQAAAGAAKAFGGAAAGAASSAVGAVEGLASRPDNLPSDMPALGADQPAGAPPNTMPPPAAPLTPAARPPAPVPSDPMLAPPNAGGFEPEASTKTGPSPITGQPNRGGAPSDPMLDGSAPGTGSFEPEASKKPYDAASSPWANFAKSARMGAWNADWGDRQNAIFDTISDTIDRVKQLSGETIPNPLLGGFRDEAAKNLGYDPFTLAIDKFGGAIPNLSNSNLSTVGNFGSPLMREQLRLYQQRLNEIAAANSAESDGGNRALLDAVHAGLNMNAAADAHIKTMSDQYAADYAKSTGTFIPWLASFLGDMWGATTRDPINRIGLLVGPGESAARSAIVRTIEQGVKQGVIQAGLTAAQEPGREERRKELGQETGFMPVLRDEVGSFLGGAIPGSIIHGIGEGWLHMQGLTTMAEFERRLRESPNPDAPKAWRDDIEEFIRKKDAGWTYDNATDSWTPPTGPGSGQKLLAGPMKDLGPASPEDIAALDEGPPVVKPAATTITPAGIKAATLDAENAPPVAPNHDPADVLQNYEGQIRHAEDPDHTAPPTPPVHVPDAPPSPIRPDNAPGGAVTRTSGYEGPDADAIKNRIAFLQHAIASGHLSPAEQQDYESRARDFQKYADARDAAMVEAGTPDDKQAAIRALHPGDVITGQDKDGRTHTGEISGWDSSGAAVVADHLGFTRDILPATISNIQTGARESGGARGKTVATDQVTGRPVHINETFDPLQLQTDAQAYQYKGGGDTAGVTSRLRGAAWDPMATGKIVVHERLDGSHYVADGHQRTGLAKDLHAQGQLPPGTRLLGDRLREADGWTVEDVRARAAKKNLQEGGPGADVIDVARVLRDHPEIWDKSLPVSDPKLKQGKGLAELSDEAWKMVLNGQVKTNFGSLVGLGVDGPNQVAVMNDIVKFKPVDENAVRMLIADANAGGFRKEDLNDLFGSQVTRSLAGERAAVFSHIMKLLRDNKRIFAMLDREQDRIEAAGNTLAGQNAAIADRAERLGLILEKLATRQGPVSAALNRSAADVADGMAPLDAARLFLTEIDRLIKEEGLKLEPGPPIQIEPRPDIDTGTPEGQAQQTAELQAAAARKKQQEEADAAAAAAEAQPPAVEPTPHPVATAGHDLINEVTGALDAGGTPEGQAISDIIKSVEPVVDQLFPPTIAAPEPQPAALPALTPQAEAALDAMWKLQKPAEPIDPAMLPGVLAEIDRMLADREISPAKANSMRDLAHGHEITPANAVSLEYHPVNALGAILSTIHSGVAKGGYVFINRPGDDKTLAFLAKEGLATPTGSKFEGKPGWLLTEKGEQIRAGWGGYGRAFSDDMRAMADKFAAAKNQPAPVEPSSTPPATAAPKSFMKVESANGTRYLVDRKPATKEEYEAAVAADQAASAPKAPEIVRGTVGMMLEPGQVVLTASGRQTTPFPKVGMDTERKTAATVKRVNRWLMDNATLEARARGDDFNAPIFEKNSDNPSPADKDGAEEYLFGDQQPAVIPSIFKPIVTPTAPEPLVTTTSGVELHSTVDLPGRGLKPKRRAEGGDAGGAAQVAWASAQDTGKPATVVLTHTGWSLLRPNEKPAYGQPRIIVAPDGQASFYQTEKMGPPPTAEDYTRPAFANALREHLNTRPGVEGPDGNWYVIVESEDGKTATVYRRPVDGTKYSPVGAGNLWTVDKAIEHAGRVAFGEPAPPLAEGEAEQQLANRPPPADPTEIRGELPKPGPRELNALSDEEFKSIKDNARYLQDFAYSTKALTDDTKTLLNLATMLGKSARDTLLMDAFNITRDAAHTINNSLDSHVPASLRKEDLQDAFKIFPGLERIFYLAGNPKIRPGLGTNILSDIEKLPDSEGTPPTSVERPPIAPPPAPGKAPTDAFVDAIKARLAEGEQPFKTIIEARKMAADLGLSVPEGASTNKLVDELVERAVVERAREIVAAGRAGALPPAETFAKIVKLYEAQPNLATRTSTSVAEQAYSTPAPLAYVASRLAGISPGTHVLEPTAGNGMLLMEADPKLSVVNELNPTRAAALEAQGFHPTVSDATSETLFADRAGQMDSIIANPPFGTVLAGGKPKTFTVDNWRTDQVDHAIAMNALKAMKADGRAVLIVGGIKDEDLDARKKAYGGQSKRRFYFQLLENYNVTDIFTVSGDLYTKQGAGWPVDVIVIEGKGKSSRDVLTKSPPPILKSWDEVGAKLNGLAKADPAAPSTTEPDRGSGRSPVEGEPGPGAGNGVGGRPSQRPKPPGGGGTVEGTERPGGVGGGGAGGESGHIRDKPPVVEGTKQPSGDGGIVQPANPKPDSNGRRPVDEDEPNTSSQDYGANNTFIKKDQAEKLAARLKALLKDAANKMSSGMDPELFAIGAQLAAYHIEAGARSFAKFTRAMMDQLGMTFAELRPGLRFWYNGARDLMEDAGLDISKMDSREVVAAELARLDAEAAAPPAPPPPPPAPPKRETNADGQTTYTPASRTGMKLNTLLPANLRDTTLQSLKGVEAEHGPVDEFVARELGYQTDQDGMYFLNDKGDRVRPFSAEQIDAIALGISNVAKGDGFIIGDQCVAGETRVYDPLSDQHVRIDELARSPSPHAVLSLTEDGFAPHASVMSFKKGRADLYRVALEDGRSITVTRQHRFLTPDGWASLESGVGVGSALAVAQDADTSSHATRGAYDPRASRWTPAWSSVVSVEFVRHDDFYDMHVPGPENYVADGFINHNTGIGKGRSQPLDSMLLTPFGWERMGDIRVGDTVVSLDGSPTKVTQIHPQGIIDVYEIEFSDGSKTRASGDHQWSTRTRNSRREAKVRPWSAYADYKVLTTDEIAATINRIYSVPIAGPAEFPSQPVPLDPYLVGACLGDACIRETGTQIVVAEPEMADLVTAALPAGFVLRESNQRATHRNIVRAVRTGKRSQPDAMPAIMRALGLAGVGAAAKFVPDIFKWNAPDVRLAVLQGLMDTDGTVNVDGASVYYSVSDTLATDVVFLVRSLGGTATRSVKKTTHQDCHVVFVRMPSGVSPFRLSRKAARVKEWTKYPPTRYIKAIRHVGREACQCITVEDPAHLYVTDDFIVTHNCVAAMIGYAKSHGMVPLFVTEKPDLYGDMWRDLHDIGWDRQLGRPINMLMTNANTRIPLDEEALDWQIERDDAKAEGREPPPMRGTFSAAQTSAAAATKMTGLINGSLAPDVVFSTYDQMNSVKGLETARRDFLTSIAPRAFLIMDEAHNAGGGANGPGLFQAKDKAPPRSDIFRQAVTAARAVMYSSATYAKSPSVMTLYSRTDMSKAVEKASQLPELIGKGGVPLQQVVASMLAQAGQYLRRERSFEGVEYAQESVPVSETAYGEFTTGIRSVFEFDRAFEEERAHLADEIAQEYGGGKSADGGIGDVSAQSTSFASIMHNVIGQMITALKAERIGQRAIEALRAGEKPVIALSKTNEAFLNEFIEAAGLKNGDVVDVGFRDILKKYLERTRRITIKLGNDEKIHVMIPLSKMSQEMVDMYRAAEDTLRDIEIGELPVSPIDHIRDTITKAGYSVREITGRGTMLDYSGDKPVIVRRPSAEEGSVGKKVTVKMFNDGRLDAIVGNKSMSTGISMHAKPGFKDLRRRRMVIGEADPNIDTHMQMLGRVHRTGQIIPPAYTHLTADIPAEVRPTAVLMRKMASLNANTTGAAKSRFTSEAVDFLNKYGDQVVDQVLNEDLQTWMRLGQPIGLGRETAAPGTAAKVTGKLTLLAPDEQQAFLDNVTAEYKALIAALDAAGENDLEAKSLDLQAQIKDTQIVKAATGLSPFQSAVNLDTASVKAIGRAMEPREVLEHVSTALKAPLTDAAYPVQMKALSIVGSKAKNTLVAETEKAENDYRKQVIRGLKDTKAKDNAEKKSRQAVAKFRRVSDVTFPGATVILHFPNGSTTPAVVIRFKRKDKATGSPVSASTWEVGFALPNSTRSVMYPLSRVEVEGFTPPTSAAVAAPGGDKEAKAGSVTISRNTDIPHTDMEAKFIEARKEGREDRHMISGNILAGYEQTRGRGQIITHTMADGSTRPAILMNKDFDPEEFMETRPVRFVDGEHVVRFLDAAPKGEVKSTDGIITIKKSGYSYYDFAVPAPRAIGGRYFTDLTVSNVLGAQVWEKKGTTEFGISEVPAMRVTVNAEKAAALVDAMRELDALFETREQQDAAVRTAPQVAPAAPKGTRAGKEGANPMLGMVPDEDGFMVDEDTMKNAVPHDTVLARVISECED